MQPDDWNITPAQRGVATENSIYQQLMADDVVRNLRRKATIRAQIEKRQAARFHKRDNDAVKRFAVTHQTKLDSKLKMHSYPYPSRIPHSLLPPAPPPLSSPPFHRHELGY